MIDRIRSNLQEKNTLKLDIMKLRIKIILLLIDDI